MATDMARGVEKYTDKALKAKWDAFDFVEQSLKDAVINVRSDLETKNGGRRGTIYRSRPPLRRSPDRLQITYIYPPGLNN